MTSCANANETRGVVTRVEDGHVWIEVSQAGCGQCAGEGACGSGLLGLRARPRAYRLPNTLDARVGDAVMVSVAHGDVLKGALLAYAMPLALGLLAAAAATRLGGGDWQAAVGLLAGIGAGWLLLRLLPRAREPGATIALQSQVTLRPRLTKETRP